MREDALTEAYLEAVRDLSSALWTHDPDGMGSTVGAPESEYEGFAARMLATLKDADSETVGSYLRDRFPTASAQLVVGCIAAIRRFQQRTGKSMT